MTSAQRGDSYNERELARQCADLLGDLDIPRPFDVDELVRRLAVRRGRHIHIIEEPDMGAHDDHASGWWIALVDIDVLFVRSGLPPLLRDAAVLHEVGHIVWDHPGDGTARAAFARMMPTLAASGALDRFGVRARRCYDTPQELEAETFARVLLSRVDSYTPPGHAAEAAAPADVAATLDRLSLALGADE